MDFMDKHLPGPKKAPPKAMEPAAPESQRVQSEAILAWINALEAFFDGGEQGSVHGFSILRHGKVIAEGSWKPFDTLHETHMLYSLSKSFASTAIGLLVDDGKLDLDERITDLFPEYVPAEPSENLKAMRVRDLLSMNVGTSHADPHKKDPGGDWVKMFVTNVIDGKPGQAFRYDSSATHVLVAIAEKRSGRTFLDFIRERLFADQHREESGHFADRYRLRRMGAQSDNPRPGAVWTTLSAARCLERRKGLVARVGRTRDSPAHLERRDCRHASG